MTEPRRDLGENNVRFTDVIGDIGKKSRTRFRKRSILWSSGAAEVCTRGANPGFEQAGCGFPGRKSS
jgi:hypothetical protein